jgi:DNA replication protein DnaC
MDEEELEAEKLRIRERIKKLAESSSEVTDEDVAVSREAAEDSLRQRNQTVRESRDKKWEDKVPPIHKPEKLSTLRKELQVIGNEWIADGFVNKKNLILPGPTGTGKTALSYAIGRELYIRGFKVKMWNALELFDDMRQQDQARDVLESVKNCDVLCLDDLGGERKTDWVEERLYIIVDYRWQWQLPTIVTTNLIEEDYTDHFSERVISRLFAGAVTRPIVGRDRRAS